MRVCANLTSISSVNLFRGSLPSCDFIFDGGRELTIVRLQEGILSEYCQDSGVFVSDFETLSGQIPIRRLSVLIEKDYREGSDSFLIKYK